MGDSPQSNVLLYLDTTWDFVSMILMNDLFEQICSRFFLGKFIFFFFFFVVVVLNER